MNFVTLDQLNSSLYRNLYKIPRDIDLIVGIPRSGMLVANLVALYLNLPLCDLNTLVNGNIYSVGNTRKCSNWISSISEAKKILVVDDSISSGKAIKQAKQLLSTLNLNCEIIYMAGYVLPTNTKSVDIYLDICNHPRMFEWNYMHHWGLEYACVDIDGVLCQDPTFIENDDGKRYKKFLLNARPKFIPTKKIGYLVTARLEKYRSETEEWLKKYNIQYDHLVMMNCSSKAERLKSMGHGQFKASIYKKTNTSIFIESSLEQALQICELTGKQVFCIENKQLIEPNTYEKFRNVYFNDTKITVKRVIKKILKRL